MGYIAYKMLSVQEEVPSAIPIQAGRRTAQPHRIAITQPKCGKDTRAGVGHERWIEVSQPAASDHDADHERQRGNEPPGHGMYRVGTGSGKNTLLHRVLGSRGEHPLRG